MERGLDQLIFFAFIVLAALVDWVVRVIRNRNAPPPPRPPLEDEDVEYYEDEAEYPEQELEPQWGGGPPVEAPRHEPLRHEPLPAPPPPPERVFDAQLPPEWRRILESQRVPPPEIDRMPVRSVPPAQPSEVPVLVPGWSRPAAASPRSAMHGNRWRRDVLWLKDANAARRAIVMMAVLGPCRALEDQPRRP